MRNAEKNNRPLPYLKLGLLIFFRWGNHPIDEAETFGHTDIVQYLKDWETNHGNKQEENPESADSSPLPQ